MVESSTVGRSRQKSYAREISTLALVRKRWKKTFTILILNSFIFFICAQKKRIFHIFRRYFESVESLQIFLTLQQGKDNEREKKLFCPKIWLARTYKNERYKKRIKFTFAEGWWNHIWEKIQTREEKKKWGYEEKNKGWSHHPHIRSIVTTISANIAPSLNELKREKNKSIWGNFGTSSMLQILRKWIGSTQIYV